MKSLSFALALLVGTAAAADQVAPEWAEDWRLFPVGIGDQHNWTGPIFDDGEHVALISIGSTGHKPQAGSPIWITYLSGARAPQHQILWSRPDRAVRHVGGLETENGFHLLIQHDGPDGYPDRTYTFVTGTDLDDMSTWSESDITGDLPIAPDIFLYGDGVVDDVGNMFFYGYSKNNVVAVFSTDDGASWSAREAVTRLRGARPVEASVFRTPEGFGMLTRPAPLKNGETGLAQVAYSFDGVRWTPLRETDLEMAGASITGFLNGDRLEILTTSRDYTALGGVEDATIRHTVPAAEFDAAQGQLVYAEIPKRVERFPGRHIGYVSTRVSRSGGLWLALTSGEDRAPVGTWPEEKFHAAGSELYVASREYAPARVSDRNLAPNPRFARQDGSPDGMADWSATTSGASFTFADAPLTSRQRHAFEHHPWRGWRVTSSEEDYQDIHFEITDPDTCAAVSGKHLSIVVTGHGPQPVGASAYVAINGTGPISRASAYRYSNQMSGPRLLFQNYDPSPLAKGAWSMIARLPAPVVDAIDGNCRLRIGAVRNNGVKRAWDFTLTGVGVYMGDTDGLIH